MLLRLVGVAVTVGLADSLNPTTVGPALYLATVPRGVVRVAQFMVGVFVVNLAGGLVLAIGPGRLLIGLIPHPQRTVRHVIELVAGVVLLGGAVAVWMGRRRLARHELPMRSGGGSALMAGASIAAVELPTALPYFAVITGMTASGATVVQQIGLLTLYNLAFVVPMVAIVIVLLTAGDRGQGWLAGGGVWLQRRWPVVLASLLLAVGAGLILVGAAGLAKDY